MSRYRDESKIERRFERSFELANRVKPFFFCCPLPEKRIYFWTQRMNLRDRTWQRTPSDLGSWSHCSTTNEPPRYHRICAMRRLLRLRRLQDNLPRKPYRGFAFQKMRKTLYGKSRVLISTTDQPYLFKGMNKVELNDWSRNWELFMKSLSRRMDLLRMRMIKRARDIRRNW